MIFSSLPYFYMKRRADAKKGFVFDGLGQEVTKCQNWVPKITIATNGFQVTFILN